MAEAVVDPEDAAARAAAAHAAAVAAMGGLLGSALLQRVGNGKGLFVCWIVLAMFMKHHRNGTGSVNCNK